MSTESRALDGLLPQLTLLTNLLRRSAALRYRRELGLAQVEWGLLNVLGRRAPLTMGELAHWAGLDLAQVSRTVSALTRRQLVKRDAGRDPRQVSLTLTAEGQELYGQLAVAARQRDRDLTAGLSAAERGTLDRILPGMTERARTLLDREQQANGQTSEEDASPGEG